MMLTVIFLLVAPTTVSATPLLPPGSGRPLAESNKNASKAIFSRKPTWHDPCGLKHKAQFRNRHQNPFFDLITPSDDDLMHNIVNMAKLALRQSRYFKEDYVSKIENSLKF